MNKKTQKIIIIITLVLLIALSAIGTSLFFIIREIVKLFA